MLPTKLVEPMKAEKATAFDDAKWIFETKWDGARVLIYISNGTTRLVSRSEKDITHKFPELKDLHKNVNAKEAIIDGELIALDENGDAQFSKLMTRNSLKNRDEIERLNGNSSIAFAAFDIVFKDGQDLRRLPLIQRKDILSKTIKPTTEFFVTKWQYKNGIELFKDAEARGIEGIMAKRAMSLYVGDRSVDWKKCKTVQRQEFVVYGFTQGKGGRQHFGSLGLAVYDPVGNLIEAGQVGSGFDAAELRKVMNILTPLVTKNRTINNESSVSVTYVKPELVVEVEFQEWTESGRIRFPSYKGMRDDKNPRQVVRE